MRDSQLQTPQRDQTSANRRTKSTPDLSRTARKVTRKSLNPVFKAVSEDDSAAFESPKECSEVSDDNPFAELPENFILNPADTLSSEKVALSEWDLTSASLSSFSVITDANDTNKNFNINPADTLSLETIAISDLTSPSLSSFSVITNATDTKCWTPDADSSNMRGFIEAELVIKHLREARLQVLKSKDLGPSKRLLDSLLDIIIKEFSGGQNKEKKCFAKVLANKSNLVFLSFIMGLFVIIIFWFFNVGAKEFYTGPAPT